MYKIQVRISAALLMMFLWGFSKGQSVIVDGKLIAPSAQSRDFTGYWAELRSEDSVLLERQKINAVGAFSFQLRFAHDYFISVNKKNDCIWRLLVHNKLEFGQVHYPVQVNILPEPETKDVYEISFDDQGKKTFLKNKMPITEITYRFETGRRDSSEIIKKQD